MLRTRLIPCLLLRDHGLVKTRRFGDAVYIGDPVNAVRIFNEKEVDELVLLDIDASREGREPEFDLVAEVAGECFMPVAYGGGVKDLAHVRRLIRCGVEKVVINSAACESTQVIAQAVQVFGSQAVVGAIDVRKPVFGSWRVMARSATVETGLSLDAHVQSLVKAGVGELLINHVDRDGTMSGFDIALIQRVARQVSVPVIACGGAGSLEHVRQAVVEGGASAVAAGSLFVFHGKHRAVLISYPSTSELSW
ncbi:MAG: Imidazole glycerol phosphate synthase subunit HisF [Burkholderiaceae bacterium]|nr:Imidazole glycerol phosphate synthase subunit HisF [Burkholderiaceae bacterium]